MRTLRNPALRVVARDGDDAVSAVSDEEIIQAFERRDRRAGELVYDHLVGVVDATLYRVMGRRETDHEDLVQATFEQIIVTLSRQSYAKGCTLRGWAASIACHVGLNAIRSRTRARRVFAFEYDAAAAAEQRVSSDAEAHLLARNEVERLRVHLASMAPAKAMTVVLHDVFGVSLTETARLTDASMPAALSRLVRGRREIRQLMASDTEGV